MWKSFYTQSFMFWKSMTRTKIRWYQWIVILLYWGMGIEEPQRLSKIWQFMDYHLPTYFSLWVTWFILWYIMQSINISFSSKCLTKYSSLFAFIWEHSTIDFSILKLAYFSVAYKPSLSKRFCPWMLYLTNLAFMQMSVEEKTTFDKRLIN